MSRWGQRSDSPTHNDPGAESDNRLRKDEKFDTVREDIHGREIFVNADQYASILLNLEW